MRSACWVLGALTPGSVARPLHPEPHARVTRNNPPLSTQNPPLLGFNFFLNFLLAQRSFSFLYFRSWRCFCKLLYILDPSFAADFWISGFLVISGDFCILMVSCDFP